MKNPPQKTEGGWKFVLIRPRKGTPAQDVRDPAARQAREKPTADNSPNDFVKRGFRSGPGSAPERVRLPRGARLPSPPTGRPARPDPKPARSSNVFRDSYWDRRTSHLPTVSVLQRFTFFYVVTVAGKIMGKPSTFSRRKRAICSSTKLVDRVSTLVTRNLSPRKMPPERGGA